MIKAKGRDVTQYWDCLNPECASKHSRKEEAQKCETPEGEPLPTSIEATAKPALPPTVMPAAEADVLLDKCLGCVAELGWLIQHATTNRHPQECSGCNCSPCSGPPCISYMDPGHEEMESGVKQLWDAMRAMVNDLRTKWMREEGVTDTTVGEGGTSLAPSVDVAKMLDALSAKLRDTKEVLKSLRVPSGNGSFTTTNPKEELMKDTKDTKKEEEPAKAEGELDAAAVMSKLDEIGGRLDAVDTALSAQGQAIANIQAKLPGEESEAAKAAATRLDTLTTEVAAIGDTVKSLAEVVGNLPTVPKGTLRAVHKEDDVDDTSKDGAPKADPFSSSGGKIQRLA